VLHETTQVDVADEPGQRIARLSGPLDVYSAFLLAQRVLAGLPDDARKLLLDLHSLSFLDSAGISALTKLRSAGKSRALDVRVYFGDDFLLHKTVVSVVRRILPSAETPSAKSA
jgi:anti-anti-sigma factor